MNVRLTFIVLTLLLVSSPASAQSPCLDCPKAAENEMTACLGSAISVDNKNACEDKREDRLKACDERECRMEREKREQKIDAPTQGP